MIWLKKLFAKWFPENDDLPDKNYYRVWKASEYLGKCYYKPGFNDCSNIAGNMCLEFHNICPSRRQVILVLRDKNNYYPDHAVVLVERFGIYDPVNRRYLKIKKTLESLKEDRNLLLWDYKIKYSISPLSLHKESLSQFRLEGDYLLIFDKKMMKYN